MRYKESIQDFSMPAEDDQSESRGIKSIRVDQLIKLAPALTLTFSFEIFTTLARIALGAGWEHRVIRSGAPLFAELCGPVIFFLGALLAPYFAALLIRELYRGRPAIAFATGAGAWYASMRWLGSWCLPFLVLSGAAGLIMSREDRWWWLGAAALPLAVMLTLPWVGV